MLLDSRHTRVSRRRSKREMLLQALQDTCEEYCNNTGIHGLKYVAERGRRLVERLLWMSVVVAGLVGAGFMVSTFWSRYSSSPTRASIETNHYPTRLLPFPAVTICNSNTIFRSKAQSVIQQLVLPPGMSRSEAYQLVSLLVEMIQPQVHRNNTVVSKANLQRFQDILDSNNNTVRDIMLAMGQSCSEMLERCKWEGELRKCSELFTTRKTYQGFCCSFNYRGVVEDTRDGRRGLVRHSSNVTHTLYYSHRMGLTVLLNPNVHDYMLSSLFSEGARARVEMLYMMQALVHGPDDYPEDAATEMMLPSGRELLLRVSATSRYCSEQVRAVSPSIRSCVFPGEVQLKYFPDYSPVNCIVECRMNYSAGLCGCLPFFYHDAGDHRLCNLKDIPCLNKFYVLLRAGTTDEDESSGMQCICPDLCNDVKYDVQSSSGDFQASRFQHSLFFSGVNVTGRTLFYLYFGDHVSVRTRRDILNNWNDLLSSLGGIFSLFLGCSLVSGVELLYFFTLRFYLHVRSSLAKLSAVDMRSMPHLDVSVIDATENEFASRHRFL